MDRAARPGSSGEPLRRRSALLLAGAGGLHAALFLVAFGLLSSTPTGDAPDEAILAFYQSGERRRLVLVGLYVMPFAGIAFLWFSMLVRVWTRSVAQEESELFSGVQLVSAILYVALFFAAAAAMSVTAVSIQFSQSAVDPMVAREFRLYGATLMLAFAMRMAAMFVFTTSRLCRLAGVLPSWFFYLSFLAGCVMLLSASFSRVLALVFPLWLVLLCTLILVHALRLPRVAAEASA
jgi:hypothetical protein